jgi:hypothetical protein
MASHVRHAALVALGALGWAACGGEEDRPYVGTGGGRDGGGGGGDGGASIDAGPSADARDVVVGGDGGQWVCHVTVCDGRVTACGDCLDNDSDGEVDSHDRECLGPCDNTEGPALEAGVGGAVGNSCGVDCYFDFGNGPGNDNCVWDHRCDPNAPEADICPYTPSLVGAAQCPTTQSPLCASVCAPLTPNGCDCFGCCTMPNAGPGGVGDRFVWIGALDAGNQGTCTFADIADPEKCPTCQPVGECLNECAACEVCIGAPPPGPECTPDEQCPGDLQPCGIEGQNDCPAGWFCISGCCQAGIP